MTHDFAGEYHGTVFAPRGWREREVLIGFDDGSHLSINEHELIKCYEEGMYYEVPPDHPLQATGCVAGNASLRAEHISVSKAISNSRNRYKVDGVWLGSLPPIGREKLQNYECIMASSKSKSEYQSFTRGMLVTVSKLKAADEGPVDEGVVICIVLSVMPSPLVDHGRQACLAAITPLESATAGLLPSVTAKYLSTEADWKIVPFSKMAHFHADSDFATRSPTVEVVKSELTSVVVGKKLVLCLSKYSKMYNQLLKALQATSLLRKCSIIGAISSGNKRDWSSIAVNAGVVCFRGSVARHLSTLHTNSSPCLSS